MDRIHHFVFTHRRSLAAVAAGLAVFFALGAIRSEGVAVVVAARDLPSGHVLTNDDLRTARFAPGTKPAGAQTADTLTGRSIGAPVRAGEPLTDRRVLDPREVDGYGVDDPVLASVRIADPPALTGVRVGDRVDLIALDAESEPVVVARGLPVAAVRVRDGETATVTLVSSGDAALDIAAAASRASLTVLTRPGSTS